jgi:hypothetical protein
VYAREVKGRELTFGVSGLLYKSNVLMYDHQTESLWSQVKRKSVTGQMTGTKLTLLPSTLTSWGKWKKRFPDTEVLTPETGYVRDYGRDPYEGYYKRSRGLFSFFKPGPGEEEKQLIAGITIEDYAKAYPLEQIRKEGRMNDKLGEIDISISFDAETDLLTIRDSRGNEIPHIVSYWFVWKSIYPASELYHP